MSARNLKPSDRGFALVSATIMLGILLAFSYILLTSSLNTRFVGNSFQQSLSAEQIAEAGLHKALFCIKATSGTNCGGTYGTSYVGQSNVSFSGGTFTTTVSGDSTTKTVTSTGTSVTGQTKRVKSDITSLPPTTAMTAAAAVQAGSGGIDMSNNVEVTGDDDTVNDSDVISVGDILCGNNAKIKGNASITRSGGKINNCTVTKNGYADLLTNDKITLNAYYLTPVTGIAGSTVSGTKYPNSPTPTPVAMPNLDIAYWKTVAAAGTNYTGNYSATNGSSIGPMKITGNYTASNNVTVTLDGPLWVTGDMTISNNGIMKLASSFGAASGIIIVDGKILLENNGDFRGSGTTGSVLIVVSNSTSVSSSSPAIMASNNVSGALLYAPNGMVYTKNNADVPAVVGLSVKMANNTTINKNGLNLFNAPINIAASGSASGWHIKDDTWREFK